MKKSPFPSLRCLRLSPAISFSLSPCPYQHSSRVYISSVGVPLSLSLASARSRCSRLRRLLRQYGASYHNEGVSLVSDDEYDRLMGELTAIEGEFSQLKTKNSPTQRVGAPPKPKKIQQKTTASTAKSTTLVRHLTPMLSLNSVNSEEKFSHWFSSLSRGLSLKDGNSFSIVEEPKYDGMAASLLYRGGELYECVTRGDGKKGDSIFSNVKFRVFSSSPHVFRPLQTAPAAVDFIKKFNEFEIRGEFVIPKQDEKAPDSLNFDSSGVATTSRNIAVGLLRRKITEDEKTPTGHQNIQFKPYSLIIHGHEDDDDKNPAFPSHLQRMEILRCFGFSLPPPRIFKAADRENPPIWQSFQQWEEQGRRTFPFEIDGIVYKIDSIEQQKTLGYSSTSPKWAIAVKFPPKVAETSLESVEWTVSRSGKSIPVGILSPVVCGGVVVKKVSLHNAATVEKFQLHRGDKIKIQRSGDVVPNIVAVTKRHNKEMDNNNNGGFHLPTHCSCDERFPLVRSAPSSAGSFDLLCLNPGCKSQILTKIVHYCSKSGMDIKLLGEKTVLSLYDGGLITDIQQFLILLNSQQKREEFTSKLIEMPGFNSTKIMNILKSVEYSHLNASPLQILSSLGIPSMGEKVAEKLLHKFAFNLQELIQSDVSLWFNIKGIKEQRIQDIYNAIQFKQNRGIIEGILKFQKENQASTPHNSP